MFRGKTLGLAVLILVVGLTAFGTGALAQGDAPACEGEYLESVRELGTIYIDALNAGDLGPWYALLADDYVLQQSPNGFVSMDRDTSRADAQGLLDTFPGIQTDIHFSTVSADCRFVTFHWSSTGTFSQPMGPFAPTGATGTVTGISVTEVEDGQIVREWISYDMLGLFQAIGLAVEIAPPAPLDATGETSTGNGGLTPEIAADFVPRFDAVINEDLGLARELFHEDFAATLPFGPNMDREGWIAYAEMIKASFPDMRQTTNLMFHQGDRLVIHVTYHATFSGQPFFGLEANGTPVAMNGIGIFRFEDGQPIENLAVLDVGELFAQIGLVTLAAPSE